MGQVPPPEFQSSQPAASNPPPPKTTQWSGRTVSWMSNVTSWISDLFKTPEYIIVPEDVMIEGAKNTLEVNKVNL